MVGKDIVVVSVCVYADSHLRFQFNLIDLLEKEMLVVGMCVCKQSS